MASARAYVERDRDRDMRQIPGAGVGEGGAEGGGGSRLQARGLEGLAHAGAAVVGGTGGWGPGMHKGFVANSRYG